MTLQGLPVEAEYTHENALILPPLPSMRFDSIFVVLDQEMAESHAAS